MAYTKTCDNCGSELGTNGVPFVQTHGSVSEQKEYSDGRVSFRYLTEYPNSKIAFCDDTCEMAWRELRRSEQDFIVRPTYPQQ